MDRPPLPAFGPYDPLLVASAYIGFFCIACLVCEKFCHIDKIKERGFFNKEMAQIRGTAGYNLGGGMQDRFGGSSSGDATSDPSPLEAIGEQTSRIEDWLDTYSDPIKP